MSEPPMDEKNTKYECMICKLIYKGLPDAYWTSHGYCERCGKIELERLKKIMREQKDKEKGNPGYDDIMIELGFVRHPDKPGHWVDPYTQTEVRDRTITRWAKESGDLRKRVHDELRHPRRSPKRKKNPPMHLLFSYGSNDLAQISERLGRRVTKADVLCAYLPDHKRVFRGMSRRWNGGTATVISKPGNNVYGYAIQVSEAELDALDIPEGARMTPPATKREIKMLKVKNGDEFFDFPGTLYVSTRREKNPPSRAYLEKCASTVNVCWRSSRGDPVKPEDFDIDG